MTPYDPGNMKCPRCGRELTQIRLGRAEVDACQGGCGGIWFDAFELEKLDEPDESAGHLLDDMRVDISALDGIDLDGRVNCPRCEGVTLMRQSYPHDQRIMIDKCGVCGGVWLDFGELFEIRRSNRNTPESKAAVADMLRSIRR